jgi:type III pantothenate kinase
VLLVVDAGNSDTVVGLFDGDELVAHRRIATDPERAHREEVGALIGDGVDGVVIATSGSALDAGYRTLVTDLTGRPPIVLVADPVGPDRLADAAGAFALIGGPCIVVDMGTATTVDVVGPDGAWAGGAIAAGMAIATAALAERADRLPAVELVAPRSAITRETDAAIRSGAVFGHAALVDGLVDRFRDELGAELPAVATGGFAAVVAPHCRTIGHVDEWLTLRGLAILGRSAVAER